MAVVGTNLFVQILTAMAQASLSLQYLNTYQLLNFRKER